MAEILRLPGWPFYGLVMSLFCFPQLTMCALPNALAFSQCQYPTLQHFCGVCVCVNDAECNNMVGKVKRCKIKGECTLSPTLNPISHSYPEDDN